MFFILIMDLSLYNIYFFLNHLQKIIINIINIMENNTNINIKGGVKKTSNLDDFFLGFFF